MPARLILNADDFGLTLGINRAIAELHSARALTSATLMASGPAFHDAVRIAHAHPSLGVGCHVVLTDGIPLAPLEHIPGLLGPDRKRLRPSLGDFVQALLRGKIKPAEIELEALFQIHRLQQAGIKITHLDTHKHTHIFPVVSRRLLALAESNHIPAIRNPFEQPWSIALGKSPILRRAQLHLIHHLLPRFLALPQIRSGTVHTTDGTLGISATGHLNPTTLAAILTAMPNGTWELVCHPGYNDPDLDAITTRLRQTREIERQALLAAFAEQSPNPIALQLINYKDLQIPTAQALHPNP